MRLEADRATHEAAERFVEVALRSDGSVFNQGKSIWAANVIDELYQAFVARPDVSSDSFLVKFRGQLGNASDDAIQLAAELLWFHFLTPTGTSGDKKREIINGVLSWMQQPARIPNELAAVLDHGVVKGGFAFTTQRPFQLAFLLEFVRHWKTLPVAETQEALVDPWKFLDVAWAVPVHRGHSQREALLYLVHPDTFEDNISRDALEKIARRFSSLVDDPTAEIHRQVFGIRQKLADKYGAGFSFWDDLHDIWSPDNTKWGQFVYWIQRFYEDPNFDTDERDYKLEVATKIEKARASLLQGGDEWRESLKDAFQPPQNIVTWQSADIFLKWVGEHEEQARGALLRLWQDSGSAQERIDAFSRALPPAATKGGLHTRLTLAAFLHMVADPLDYPPYRYSAFRNAMKLVEYEDLPAGPEGTVYQHTLDFLDRLSEEAESRGLSLRDRLDAQGLVWCIYSPGDKPESWSEETWAAYQKYHDRGAWEEEEGEEGAKGEDGEAHHSASLGLLARELHFEAADLQRIVDLLDHRSQIIFNGPPGTGKTFVARKLARFLAGATERVTLVQFHPSYTYEDFMEGYRPVLLEGRQPGFEIVEGPLREIARNAAAEPSKTFVLVIDEINRGNLAKIFGELYFLLEYRQDQIRLQYSKEFFSLPENLLIIGTMNTADRSIALVDAALRRRFHFFPFFPDEPPVKGLLGRWLEDNGPDFSWLADVLDQANRRLDDRHMAIGPSHFMNKDRLSNKWIEIIWQHSVLPSIEEHFYGDRGRLKEFEFAALKATVSGTTAADRAAEGQPQDEDSDS